MTRVTIQHLRTVPGARGGRGYCVHMSKPWALRQGLDWRAFVRDGIDAEALEATGDPFALRLAQHARECEVKAKEHGNG